MMGTALERSLDAEKSDGAGLRLRQHQVERLAVILADKKNISTGLGRMRRTAESMVANVTQDFQQQSGLVLDDLAQVKVVEALVREVERLQGEQTSATAVEPQSALQTINQAIKTAHNKLAAATLGLKFDREQSAHYQQAITQQRGRLLLEYIRRAALEQVYQSVLVEHERALVSRDLVTPSEEAVAELEPQAVEDFGNDFMAPHESEQPTTGITSQTDSNTGVAKQPQEELPTVVLSGPARTTANDSAPLIGDNKQREQRLRPDVQAVLTTLPHTATAEGTSEEINTDTMHQALFGRAVYSPTTLEKNSEQLQAERAHLLETQQRLQAELNKLTVGTGGNLPGIGKILRRWRQQHNQDVIAVRRQQLDRLQLRLQEIHALLQPTVTDQTVATVPPSPPPALQLSQQKPARQGELEDYIVFIQGSNPQQLQQTHNRLMQRRQVLERTQPQSLELRRINDRLQIIYDQLDSINQKQRAAVFQSYLESLTLTQLQELRLDVQRRERSLHRAHTLEPTPQQVEQLQRTIQQLRQIDDEALKRSRSIPEKNRAVA